MPLAESSLGQNRLQRKISPELNYTPHCVSEGMSLHGSVHNNIGKYRQSENHFKATTNA